MPKEIAGNEELRRSSNRHQVMDDFPSENTKSLCCCCDLHIEILLSYSLSWRVLPRRALLFGKPFKFRDY